jgi:hypothetical protein
MKRPDWDLSLALGLLIGISRDDHKREFLSPNSPTEKDARQALARILRNGDVPAILLEILADQIDPDGRKFRFRRIEFKNLSQGHPQYSASFDIARRVYELRQNKEKNAIDKVAKEVGMTSRHVARIYSKHREEVVEYALTPVPKLVS